MWGTLPWSDPRSTLRRRDVAHSLTSMAERVAALNPVVLRWARERAGLSLADVAVRLKRKPEIVADWESGTDSPTFRQLEELADHLYKRPLAIFFFPNPPEEEDPGTRFRTLPQSELDAFDPDTRYALREALAFQEGIRQLSGDENPATRLITRDIRPIAGYQVVELAGRVRSYFGVPLASQFSWPSPEHAFKLWRRAVEGAGVFVFKRSFRQEDVFGFCLHDNVIPIIVINNSTAFSRQTFTLFHELGHLLYSISGITTLDMRYIDSLVGHSRDVETACNGFAAEFLVPNSTFPWAEFKPTRLDDFARSQAGRYKVSREVILRRLLDRGLVSQALYLRKSEQWKLEYQRSREGPTGGNYYATRASYLGDAFLQLAFTQYRLGKVSLDELASYLRMKARNVSRLEDFVLKGE
jgi:Zn-dependent peptidase ImmA (M78 family)/DNA-binding transcriptional regulator YiaG